MKIRGKKERRKEVQTEIQTTTTSSIINIK
jgi:hypothetical protein